MRRKDREIKEKQDMITVMNKCDVCRIALNHEDGYPYIIPLNFALTVTKGRVELYFHGALEGTKYELMERDPRVSFEMDCSHELVFDEEKGSCSMNYESVIGRGHMEIIPEEEKLEALGLIMEQYGREDFEIRPEVMKITRVFKLVVEEMTGKSRYLSQ